MQEEKNDFKKEFLSKKEQELNDVENCQPVYVIKKRVCSEESTEIVTDHCLVRLPGCEPWAQSAPPPGKLQGSCKAEDREVRAGRWT